MMNRIDSLLAYVIRHSIRLIPRTTRRVRTLITNQDDILLVVNRLSHVEERWTLPGGGIKANESVEQAARREVREELKIDLTLDSIHHEGVAEYTHGRFREQLEITIAATEQRVFRRQKLEIVEARWFPIDNLPQSAHPIVNEAIKHLKDKS